MSSKLPRRARRMSRYGSLLSWVIERTRKRTEGGETAHYVLNVGRGMGPSATRSADLRR